MKKRFLIAIIVWVFLFAGCSEDYRVHVTHRVGRRPVHHKRVYHRIPHRIPHRGVMCDKYSPGRKVGHRGRYPMYGKGKPGMHGRGRHGNR